jgi:hypothetical protein
LGSTVVSGHTVLGMGGEVCFGTTGGCAGAFTPDNTKSFLMRTPVTKQYLLLALYGDISDSTFDSTGHLGGLNTTLPTAGWTARNDFYVYHGADCPSSAINGPGDYYASIPPTAIHLTNRSLHGQAGAGVQQDAFYVPVLVKLVPGDCLVTLFGMDGVGSFNAEDAVRALVAELPEP